MRLHSAAQTQYNGSGFLISFQTDCAVSRKQELASAGTQHRIPDPEPGSAKLNRAQAQGAETAGGNQPSAFSNTDGRP